jgi:hypothetical protein
MGFISPPMGVRLSKAALMSFSDYYTPKYLEGRGEA